MHILRKWRKRIGLTLDEASQLFRMKPPSLSNIEREINLIGGDRAILASQITGIDLFKIRPDLKITDKEKKLFLEFKAQKKQQG